jgi:hypothetical protein
MAHKGFVAKLWYCFLFTVFMCVNYGNCVTFEATYSIL